METSGDEACPEEGEEEETKEDDAVVEPHQPMETEQSIKEPEKPVDRSEERILGDQTNSENKEGETSQTGGSVGTGIPLPVSGKTQPTESSPPTQPTPPAMPSKSSVKDGS